MRANQRSPARCASVRSRVRKAPLMESTALSQAPKHGAEVYGRITNRSALFANGIIKTTAA
jgi:hypothetical protein